mgnify:FL=1
MRKTCFFALLVLFSSVAGATTTTYTGEAVVRSITPTRVAVFLDTVGDHMVDNGFLLTTDIPMHDGLAVRLQTAQLVFTEGYLRVSGGDNVVYDLQVAGYPEPPAAPKDSEVITLIGSALMHTSRVSDCDIERAHEKDAGTCYAYRKK